MLNSATAATSKIGPFKVKNLLIDTSKLVIVEDKEYFVVLHIFSTNIDDSHTSAASLFSCADVVPSTDTLGYLK